MGAKDKKKDSKSNTTTNTKEKTEPEKKGKGHKQKGAGTVVVSKGEVTVGGVVMKEWQRTPVQLVQEYCQKQKRPKPVFQNDRAPAGSFIVRVILPDPKNKEKDLVFTSSDSFPDMVLAKNSSCLLALHHLQPTLPLHQKLPEPYSSMWLKLTGSSQPAKQVKETPQFVCSICNRSFEKELGLKIHMKKDHSGKKAAEESPTTPTSPLPTPAPPLPPPNPKRIVADHRNDSEFKEISLESKNHFTSKYDRMMAEEKKRIHQSQYEKKKEIERQLKKPPTVFLSDSNQAFIQALLQQQEELLQGDEQSSSKELIRTELIELGFSTPVIVKALSIPSNRTTMDCIDWCCIHLKDEDLPLQFRASGNQISLQKRNKENETLIDYLNEFGFSERAYQELKKQGIEDDMILCELLKKVIPGFSTKMRSDSEQEILNEELEALKSIYFEMEEKWFGSLQILRIVSDQFTIVYVLSKSFSYPQCKPVVFIMAKEIAKHQRIDFMRFLYTKYEVGHSNLLYELMIDYEELIKEYHRELLKPQASLPSTSKPTRKSTAVKQSVRKRVLDKQLLEGSPSPQVQKQRQDLPITKYRSEVLEMIQSNQISLVSGGTGCGKSTQVPQFLIEEFKQSDQQDLNIVVCEPRRISCLGLYNRILVEQGYSPGPSCPVGYQVRGDSKHNNNTVLTYCTTGVLLRQLQNDLSTGITHIIVDEIHERSILSDFLLLLLKRIIKKNHTIKIILMSATMDQSLFSSYFNTLASISVEGRLYPIEEHYLDDIVFDLHYQPTMFTRIDYSSIQRSTDMEDLLTQWCEKYQDYHIIPAIIHSIFKSQVPWKGGVVLVFLSGSSEIKNVNDILEDYFYNDTSYDVDIIQCHGSLSTQEQKRVFEDNPSRHRIVLATNIAETSITIPNCKYVIDTGKEKRVCYNSESHISEMKEVWISRASAEQRKGRAGRVQNGLVYRLYTRKKFTKLEDFTPPEMLRSPLDGICLQVLRMKLGNPDKVLPLCITPPSSANVQSALDILQEIQAIQTKNDTIELTSLGFHLADLPVDCRLGKILLFACLLHCVESVVTIAAFLSQRSVFRAPLEKREEMMACKRQFSYRLSDHLTLLRLYKEYRDAPNKRQFCYENFVNYESMMTIHSLRTQFIQELQNIHFLPRNYSVDSVYNSNNNEENIIKAALTAGMYSNVIKIEKTKIRFHRTIEGGSFESTPEAKEYRLLINREIDGCECKNGLSRVYIHPSSINFSEREYTYPFMIYTTILNTTKLFVHDTTVIPPYCLLLFAGKISIQYMDGTISIDDWLQFTAPARVGVLIQRLRDYVDLLLHKKFDSPESSIASDPVLEKICSLLITNGL